VEKVKKSLDFNDPLLKLFYKLEDSAKLVNAISEPVKFSMDYFKSRSDI